MGDVVFGVKEFANFDTTSDCYDHCLSVLEKMDSRNIREKNGNLLLLYINISLYEHIYDVVLCRYYNTIENKYNYQILLETELYSSKYYADVSINDYTGLLSIDQYYSLQKESIRYEELKTGSNVMLLLLHTICYIFHVRDIMLYDDSTINNLLPLPLMRRIAGQNTFYEDFGYQADNCTYSMEDIYMKLSTKLERLNYLR
jgi:hypothetical protein